MNQLMAANRCLDVDMIPHHEFIPVQKLLTLCLQQFLDIFSECKKAWPYERMAPTRLQFLDLYKWKQLLLGRSLVAILVEMQGIIG